MFRKRNAVLNVRIPLDGPCYADAQLACLLSARLQATTAGYSPFPAVTSARETLGIDVALISLQRTLISGHSSVYGRAPDDVAGSIAVANRVCNESGRLASATARL